MRFFPYQATAITKMIASIIHTGIYITLPPRFGQKYGTDSKDVFLLDL